MMKTGFLVIILVLSCELAIVDVLHIMIPMISNTRGVVRKGLILTGIFDVDSTLNRRRNFDGRRKSVENVGIRRKSVEISTLIRRQIDIEISTVVEKVLKNVRIFQRRNLPAGKGDNPGVTTRTK